MRRSWSSNNLNFKPQTWPILHPRVVVSIHDVSTSLLSIFSISTQPTCHNLVIKIQKLTISSLLDPLPCPFKSSMLYSCSRILSYKNLNFASLSASFLLSKQLSFNSKQAVLLSLHNLPVPLISQSLKAGLPRPLLGSLRFNHSMASQSSAQSVHDFTVKDARGNDVDLSVYKGKVLLIVNVASQCGLTNSNYTELSQLYEKYKDQDLEILAFPCNQFGSQEPGNNEQILEFACTRFKAEYPIFDKVDVNGNNAAPIYKFLKSSKGGLFGDNIKWNFSKFLVDKDGKVVDRYAPTTSPLSIEKDVKKLLGIA